MVAKGTSWIKQVTNKPFADVREHNFAPKSPGGTLTAGVLATVTIPQVPAGVNGSDAFHCYYISGGTGTPETVWSSGGTAIAGADSGTLIFTPANNHSGAWTITSATGGILEALIANPNKSIKAPGIAPYSLNGPIAMLDTTVSVDLGGDINDQGGPGSTVLNNLQTAHAAAISAATNAASAVFTSTHGFPANSRQLVTIMGATAAWTTANATFIATILSPTTFSIPLNSTTFGALSGSLTFTSGHAIVRDGNSGNRVTRIHDLMIVGTGVSGDGIRIRTNAGLMLERLNIVGASTANGIYCNLCDNGFIKGCGLIFGNINGVVLDTCNNLEIDDEIAFIGNSGIGVSVTGSVGSESICNRIENCDFESNGRAISVVNSWRTYVKGIWCEGNTLPNAFGANTIGITYNGNYHLGPAVKFDGSDAVGVHGCTFQGSNSHLEITSFDQLVYDIGEDNVYNLGSPIFPGVAQFSGLVTAAASTTLPYSGRTIDVAVGVGITSIPPHPAGTVKTLRFQGVTTVTNGSNLKLAGNFTSTAYSTLTIESDNVNWFELMRSVRP